jgi:hypothetical protein
MSVVGVAIGLWLGSLTLFSLSDGLQFLWTVAFGMVVSSIHVCHDQTSGTGGKSYSAIKHATGRSPACYPQKAGMYCEYGSMNWRERTKCDSCIEYCKNREVAASSNLRRIADRRRSLQTRQAFWTSPYHCGVGIVL